MTAFKNLPHVYCRTTSARTLNGGKIFKDTDRYFSISAQSPVSLVYVELPQTIIQTFPCLKKQIENPFNRKPENLNSQGSD